MNRRNRTLIVLGVAVTLAALASFGVYRAIRNIPVREVQIATSYAVVAKDAIPVGVLLTKEQVKVVAWPQDSPVPGGFTKVDDVVGRGVVSALVPNEPLTENKLAPREAGGGLPPTIPQGMRAMSVRVNDVIGVAGFTVPGTRVDVVVTVHDKDTTTSRIVLDNIQVLTAGTRYDQQKSKDGEPIATNVVTLLVTPHDAERLTLAQQEGQIVLALRNPMDVNAADTTGVHLASLLGAPEAPPVKQIVKGQPRMVAPPPPPAPRPYTVNAIRGGKSSEEVVQ
jgi:pilus assembly protein CpaB